MHLLTLDEAAPAEVEQILLELGPGDARFSGTTFARGECTLEVFLQQCRDREDPGKVPDGVMPQTVYWLANEAGRVVGIVRIRPRLDEKLSVYGGHIGYYIRPSERGRRYGTAALQLALIRLREHGVTRALLTIHPDNIVSMRMALAAGAVADGQSASMATGDVVNRYWIEL